MKFHMLMLMNEWMMLVLMKCKCKMQCLTLGCYTAYPSTMERDNAFTCLSITKHHAYTMLTIHPMYFRVSTIQTYA